jgi:hypothetical protein
MAQSVDQIRANVHSANRVGWNTAIARVVERLRAESNTRTDDKERATFLAASVLCEGMTR